MACATVATTQCMCSFGMAPSAFLVCPIPGQPVVLAENKLMANIMDNKPMVNIMPFGMCQAPTNPAVVAATAAAFGTPTPAPCVPVTTAPWAMGSTNVLVKNMPALNSNSKLMCNWGGVIQLTPPGGAPTVQVP